MFLTDDESSSTLMERTLELSAHLTTMWRKSILIAVFALGWGVLGLASGDSGDVRQRKVTLDRKAVIGGATTDQKHVAPSVLRIEHVRLEPPPPMQTLPSTVLKFEAYNTSSNRVADVVFEISIVEKLPPSQEGALPRVLVGPFTIRGDFVLESGYTINYEMLLRNLASDCACVAKVDVLSVRSLPDSGS
jgi:hypothetical protein